MINKVILIGNLGKDPEVRTLESGASVARLTIATNESYKDKSGEWQNLTEWHNVICWRHLAERAERDLKKGGKVYIEGKLTTRKWTDKDNNDRYTTEVIANTFRSLEKREGSGVPFPTDDSKAATNKTPSDVAKDNTPEGDDDLPF